MVRPSGSGLVRLRCVIIVLMLAHLIAPVSPTTWSTRMNIDSRSLQATARASGAAPGPSSEVSVQLEVVVLSTFPRSGTSWVRELIRGASGISFGASGRTLTKHASELLKLRDGHGAAQSRVQVARRLVQMRMLTNYTFPVTSSHTAAAQSTLPGTAHESDSDHQSPAPTPMSTKAAATLRLSGIKPSVLQRVLSGRSESNAACSTLPRYRWGSDDLAIPPLLLKSHYPVIDRKGDGLKMVTESDRRIHLVRNPWDNLMSKFHGSGMATKEGKIVQWEAFLAAVSQNATTPAFSKHLNEKLPAYVHFHEYWRGVELLAPANAVYVHYESLCHNISTVLPRIMQFAGIHAVDGLGSTRFRCAIDMMPCSAGSSSRRYPEHLAMYTDAQADAIREATTPLLQSLGYKVVGRGRTVSVEVDPEACDASLLQFILPT